MPFNYPAGRNPKKRGNIDLQRCGIAQEGGRKEKKKKKRGASANIQVHSSCSWLLYNRMGTGRKEQQQHVITFFAKSLHFFDEMKRGSDAKLADSYLSFQIVNIYE